MRGENGGFGLGAGEEEEDHGGRPGRGKLLIPAQSRGSPRIPTP
jgi:hypothetical protein